MLATTGPSPRLCQEHGPRRKPRSTAPFSVDSRHAKGLHQLGRPGLGPSPTCSSGPKRKLFTRECSEGTLRLDLSTRPLIPSNRHSRPFIFHENVTSKPGQTRRSSSVPRRRPQFTLPTLPWRCTADPTAELSFRPPLHTNTAILDPTAARENRSPI